MHAEDSTASFGYWIRRQRQALDLTQAELARRVGCATVTISKLERDERRPSRQIAELLAEKLAVADDQRTRFLAAALGERSVDGLPLASQPVGPPSDDPSAASHLPSTSAPAIQRTNDENTLLTLLADPVIRLITLVGPGGVGKTHLSLRVAEKAVGSFRDGVVFVPLDAVRNPAMVLTALAGSLGVMESRGQSLRDSLLAALEYRRRLLVLDNFEQVVEAAELVAAILQRSPHLKILVTSREALHLKGEQLYPLHPLELPPVNSSVGDLYHSQAVQLFGLRAQAAQPDFVLDDTTAPTVAAICTAVDGLPLAIELAAARLSLFSLTSLLQELNADERSPLRILRTNLRDAPQRHRSLIDTVAWSYDLLTDDEQRLFRRLAVFVGSFSLDAAQTVAGENADILESVHSLVSKSLLVVRSQEDGSRRFAYLQTIRDVALKLLAQSGEEAATRLAHARWYAALAVVAEEKIHSHAQIYWLDRLSTEADNIHAAIGWSIDNDEHELALTFGESLLWFWWIRNLLGIGNYWMKRLLPLLQPSVPLARQAKLYYCAGMIGQLQGEYVEAMPLYETGLAQAQESGSFRVESTIRSQMGWVRTWQRSFDIALSHFEEAIRISEFYNFRWELGSALSLYSNYLARIGRFEEAVHQARRAYDIHQKDGSHWGMSWALIQIAHPLVFLDRIPEARLYTLESRRQSELIKDKLAIGWSLSSLGRIAFLQKEYDEARRAWLEMLELRWERGDIHGVVAGIASVAQVEIQCHRFAQAVALTRVVQKEGARMGAANAGTEWMQPEEIFAAARAALSPEEFATAWAEGEVRSLADVVEELLHPD